MSILGLKLISVDKKATVFFYGMLFTFPWQNFPMGKVTLIGGRAWRSHYILTHFYGCYYLCFKSNAGLIDLCWYNKSLDSINNSEIEPTLLNSRGYVPRY